MTKQELEQTGLIEMYVMGLTDEQESQKVETVMNEDPAFRNEVIKLQKGFEKYIQSHATPPPVQLKQRVMQDINGGRSGNVQTGRSRFFWSIAAAILLAALSTTLLFKANGLQNSLDEARANLIDCQEDKQGILEANAAYAANESFISDQATQKILVSGTANMPEATLLAFYNSNQEKTMYQAINLPPPPAGKCYQMWADVEGEMINMGVLPDDLSTIHTANFIASAESINITIEELGGADHPTVERLVANGQI